jgi:SAM-dependent methyltransferase
MKLFKKLNYGQKLRRKSKVHESIIDKDTGRRKKTATGWINEMLKARKENWISKGDKLKLDSELLLRKDLISLKKIEQPKIMILGPGQGQEVLFLNNLLKENSPKIDVFGITNELSTAAKKIVRNANYPSSEKLSERNLFEHFNHLKFVNKYDYIYSCAGPVEHTSYPEIVILKIASMLRPGGIARIMPAILLENDTNLREYLKLKKDYREFSFENTVDGGYILIKRLK